MQGFNKDIEGLINGLYRPSIFYIPAVLFPKISEELKQKFKDYRVTNELAILKQTGDTCYIEQCIPLIELLHKESSLENNLFQLHKFKDQLKQVSFKFILDNYMKHVSACTYVYSWLYDHVLDVIENLTEDQKQLFDLQYRLINKHQECLENAFLVEKPIAIEHIEELIATHTHIFKDRKFNELLTDINKEKDNSKQNNKKLLLTDLEADTYLLKTVFNVKFQDKNH
jgi:hypothetical protein